MRGNGHVPSNAFRFPNKPAPDVQTIVLYCLLCILPLVHPFFITTPALAASAGWAATYGADSGDLAFSIQQTSDGGYIVAGGTQSFGAGIDDFWVLRLRLDGSIEWQKTYGGELYEWAYSIRQTSDGGYIVAGETISFGNEAQEIWVLKLRPDGSINPSCYSIITLDTSISGKDSSATIKTTSADAIDSNINPQDSSAIVQDTNVSANILCP